MSVERCQGPCHLMSQKDGDGWRGKWKCGTGTPTRLARDGWRKGCCFYAGGEGKSSDVMRVVVGVVGV